MANNIPNDVVANEILTRLPAKCLGRCKCVCKEWRSHIEGPRFVQLHHDSMSKIECNLSLVLVCGTSLYAMHHFLGHNSTTRCLTPLLLPAFAKNTGINIVGSHNGLICVGSGKTLNNYFVYNPVMPQNLKILPYAQNVLSRTFGGMSIDFVTKRCYTTPGFGFDQIGKTYKLVYIFILTDDRDPQPEGMVYNSGTGSWTRLEPPMYLQPPTQIDRWVFCGVLNNSLHFVGQRNTNVVITFDLHTENWGEINLPCCKNGYEVEKEVHELEEGYVIREVYEIIDASVIRGCLTALIIDHGCKYPTFWVLKNYGDANSWIKLFTLPIFRVSRIFRVLYYIQNSPLVLLLLNEGYSVIWYNCDNGNVLEVIGRGTGVEVLDCRVIFMNSLVSVPGLRGRQEVLERKGDAEGRLQRGAVEVKVDDRVERGKEKESEEIERLLRRDLKKKERAEKRKMKKIEKMEKKKMEKMKMNKRKL
ncbi:hypothetical protein vseg_007759 [Gypsophila vaccaria]